MKTLIVGGAGFIGRHLLPKIEGEVVVLDTAQAIASLGGNSVSCDITDAFAMEALANQIGPIDRAVHLAAMAAPSIAQKMPGVTWSVNVHGTYNVLRLLQAVNCRRVVAFCYDAATRALTKSGLKSYDDLRPGDEVLSLNQSSEVVEWKRVRKVHVFPYDGEMLRFSGRSVDLCVTPNHRMFIRNRARKGGRLVFEEAAQVAKRHTFLYPDGLWPEVGPDPSGLSETQFYLLGIYIGDGYLYRGRQIATTGLRRKDWLKTARTASGEFISLPAALRLVEDESARAVLCIPPTDKSRDRVEAALAKIGVAWNEDTRGNIYFNATTCRLESIFRKCGGSAATKHVPREFLDAPRRHLKRLLDGLMDSDGNRDNAFTTVSNELALNVVEIATKLGRSGTIAVEGPKRVWIQDHWANSGSCFRVSVRHRPKWSVRTRENVQRIDYHGTVWCPEVEDNGNLLVERNGRFTFCGNSSAHVYGISPRYLPTDEQHPLWLQDPYTASKIFTEQLCQLFHANFGIGYCALRLFNGYGSRQTSAYFIPAKIKQAREAAANGEKVMLLRGRSVTKDWVHVQDIAEATVRALESDFVGAINIGTGVETSLEAIARQIADAYGLGLEFEGDDKPTRMCASWDRAKTVLGWEPRVEFRQGLASLITGL